MNFLIKIGIKIGVLVEVQKKIDTAIKELTEQRKTEKEYKKQGGNWEAFLRVLPIALKMKHIECSLKY